MAVSVIWFKWQASSQTYQQPFSDVRAFRSVAQGLVKKLSGVHSLNTHKLVKETYKYVGDS